MGIFQHLRDVFRGSTKLGLMRSSQWRSTERKFRALHPGCRVCGTDKNVEVHHKLPFHDRPDLELDLGNLISLCRIHHQWWGHLGDWKSFNPDVEADATAWARKITARPKSGGS